MRPRGTPWSTARLIKLMAQCFVLSEGLRSGAEQAERDREQAKVDERGQGVEPRKGQEQTWRQWDAGIAQTH